MKSSWWKSFKLLENDSLVINDVRVKEPIGGSSD